MKVIAWPKKEGEDAAELHISSLEALWQLVWDRTKTLHEGYIHELSANCDDFDIPYLVLSWVEVEDA